MNPFKFLRFITKLGFSFKNMLVVKYNDQWFIFQQNFYNKNVGALMIIILNHYVLQRI